MPDSTFDLIEINPDVLSGQPVIKGTRLPVYAIVEAIAEGDTKADLQEGYPFLSEEAIQQALLFAARMSRLEVEMG